MHHCDITTWATIMMFLKHDLKFNDRAFGCILQALNGEFWAYTFDEVYCAKIFIELFFFVSRKTRF